MSDPSPLPACESVEAAILGCVLEDPLLFTALQEAHVNAHWFYHEKYKEIWRNFEELVQFGKTIDEISYDARFGRCAALYDLRSNLPSIAHFPSWLEDLQILYQRREVIQAAEKVGKAAASHQADLSQILSQLEQASRIVQFGPGQKNLPKLEDACQLLSREITPDEEIIEGLLRRKGILLNCGSAKGHKSWSLLDAAILLSSVDRGQWFGRPVKKCKVLYCNFELTDFDMKLRIEQIAKHRKIEVSKNWFQVWNLKGYRIAPMSFLVELVKRAKAMGAAVIILDPIYKVYDDDLDENKAGDIAKLLSGLEAVAREANSAIMYSHHFAKGDQSTKDPMDRASGSGVFKRQADAIVVVTETLNTENGYCVDFICRAFAPLPKFGVVWEFPVFVSNPDMDLTIKNAKKGGREKLRGDEAYALLLDSGGMTSKEWADAVEETLGASASTLKNVRKRLELDGKVVKRNGRYFSMLPNPAADIEKVDLHDLLKATKNGHVSPAKENP